MIGSTTQAAGEGSAKLEALHAAWGLLAKLPGTDFRQRCRRKRVFNVLEGSKLRFYIFACTSVDSWIDYATHTFCAYSISRSPRRASCGVGRERGGGGGWGGGREQLNIGGNRSICTKQPPVHHCRPTLSLAKEIKVQV